MMATTFQSIVMIIWGALSIQPNNNTVINKYTYKDAHAAILECLHI